MSFLAPLYLLVGMAAAVPLLLHLMRRNVATRVEFPAARYLERAEQEHSRSLRLKNFLLMLLRVLLVLTLALAAARPLLSGLGVGHGPTALAIVLDNSLSTSAVIDGAPVFSRLRAAAQQLVSATTSADRLWLVTADGALRGGSREAVLADLERLVPSEDAGDLPLALRRAAAAVHGSALPARTVAVATDGQASAWTGVRRVDVPVSLFLPGGTPPRNRAVLSLDPDPAIWTPRGAISARIDATDSVGYRLLIGNRTLARGAASRVEPDDFAADDARHAAVWIGPPPGVTVDPSAGQFASTAVAALVGDGRARPGHDVAVASADLVSALPALITPPATSVRMGAANRALEKLGIPWRFAAVDNVPAIAKGARLDGVTVTSRYHLERAGTGSSDTLATVGGEPWIVAGPRYVLVASRLDPEATTLPVRAQFVPWLADVVSLRLAATGEDVTAPIKARPGAAVQLPVGADAIENVSGTRRSLAPDHAVAPDERGVWFVVRGGRRIGALVVNAPPEESRLDRQPASALAPALAGSKAQATDHAAQWVSASLSAGTRRPVLVPLLLFALVLLAAEALVVRSTRTVSA